MAALSVSLKAVTMVALLELQRVLKMVVLLVYALVERWVWMKVESLVEY